MYLRRMPNAALFRQNALGHEPDANFAQVHALGA